MEWTITCSEPSNGEPEKADRDARKAWELSRKKNPIFEKFSKTQRGMKKDEMKGEEARKGRHSEEGDLNMKKQTRTLSGEVKSEL